MLVSVTVGVASVPTVVPVVGVAVSANATPAGAAHAAVARGHVRWPVIYTTNSIESLNYQLRKVTKNRGHFPGDAAVVKLLWLAICTIEDKRARDREKEKGLPAERRRAAGRLVEGQVTTNWKKALAQLAIAYPDRINPHL
ncbi:putative transposase [Mobilicoccus pelagius NBRC 104925]|uniref:Putative transposase n=1 Tax=Mobilicoccus pelagius NBRC 104925 TaxID=1089455 RepID=H5UU83_9MICO|nr:putative transposase [Mobilicoccus pelagius NBRC 104925]